MSITQKVESKVIVPTFMGILNSLCTVLLEPSKALTMMLLGFKVSPQQSSRSRVFLGKTFNDEPVSTRTWASMVPLHSMETCKASLCFLPLEVKSASEKPNLLSAVRLATQFSNWSMEVSWGMWEVLRNFTKALAWVSEHKSKDNNDIFEGVYPNCSTMLQSLFLIIFSISSISFLEASRMISRCSFAWTGSFKTSLPLVSVAGMTVRVSLGVSVGVAVGMITGVATVFGEIQGEKTLPLLVILLVPVILPTPGSIPSETLSLIVNKSCLMPW